MKRTFTLIALIAAMPALAEDTRELDAHEHGVSELNIAIDGSTIAMEFHAPGGDIVGFEYEATYDEDKAAIEAALATLSAPLDLFVLPAAAVCSVVQASAELEGEDAHDEHDEHGEESHDDHKDHDDHADHEKEDDHEKHDDHDDHAEEEAGHTEFHAEYSLTCANPKAATNMTFAYFTAFENAKEVEVQIVSPTGAQAFEVERDAPELDLSGAL